MLIITKENNSIKVVGQNNPTYPYSGTLVYPLNSVTVVTDQSDMAVFRSALNNDVLFTGLIENITIAGSPVTKEDIGTKFGAIANSSGSGGGGTGGAVDSVNGQTGTVVLTAADVNAYSKAETDEKLRDYTPLEAYATEIASIKTNMGNKADKSSLDNYLLKTDAQTNYQAKLTAGTGIEITGENVINVTLDTNIYQVVESLPDSDINPNKIYLVLNSESGESDLYIEYLYVNNKWEKIGEYKADVDLTPYLTKADAANTYQPKGEYLTSIPEEYVTETELEGKDYALNASLEAEVTERQKQDSALGGMIAGETQAREQAISNLTATVQGKLDTATYNSEKATFALKTEIPSLEGYATEAWVTEQGYLTEHQDISGLATKEELNGKQNTLVSGTNIKTINSQSLLGEGNIEITVEGGGISDAPSDGKLYGRKNAQWTEVVIPDTSDLATKGELSAKLDTATYNEEKATFALKTEIPDTSNLATKTELSEGLAGKANTSDLSNYLTTANAQSTYATKGELGAKLDVETYNSDKATFALKSEVPKQYVQEIGFVAPTSINIFDQDSNYKIISFTDGITLGEDGENVEVKLDDSFVNKVNAKQDTLVSGTNIKTVNGNSLLGSGDITIEGGGSGATTWDYSQLVSDSATRSNFVENGKVGDIITNITYEEYGKTDAVLSTKSATANTWGLYAVNYLNPIFFVMTVTASSTAISLAFDLNKNIVVDNAISSTSENPVQNKVISAELNKKVTLVNADLATYENILQPGDKVRNIPGYESTMMSLVVSTNTITSVNVFGVDSGGKQHLITLDWDSAGTGLWTVSGEIEISQPSGGSGIATWDYAQIQSDQEYRTNFLTNVKVSDDLTNLGGSDNPEHASILTIDGNVYTVMYNVGGNPKVASINIQESVATITNIDAIPKNVATTTENGLMSSADKTKLDSIDVESILSRITALETQMGEVSARLDNINGEVVA